jgi:hypothetical protein
MTDKRRIRFNDLEGLTRDDLALATEIWLDDVCEGRWSTSEVQKIGAVLMGWIRSPDLAEHETRSMEDKYRLTREEVQRAFNLLKLFGFVESFSVDREGVKAVVRLSILQRLRVLEAKRRYQELLLAAAEQAHGHAPVVALQCGDATPLQGPTSDADKAAA